MACSTPATPTEWSRRRSRSGSPAARVTGFLSALVLAVALATDAFAVALTQGARFRPGWRHGAAIAMTFGVFQGAMPLTGWAMGAAVLIYVAAFDHWIAAGLLVVLGVRMMFASEDGHGARGVLSGLALLGAGIATSVDALAAGLTLPTLAFPPARACLLIGLVTTFLCAMAVKLGSKAGDRFGRTAEITGGILLIVLGVKIPFDHLSAG